MERGGRQASVLGRGKVESSVSQKKGDRCLFAGDQMTEKGGEATASLAKGGKGGGGDVSGGGRGNSERTLWGKRGKIGLAAKKGAGCVASSQQVRGRNCGQQQTNRGTIQGKALPADGENIDSQKKKKRREIFFSTNRQRE